MSQTNLDIDSNASCILFICFLYFYDVINLRNHFDMNRARIAETSNRRTKKIK